MSPQSGTRTEVVGRKLLKKDATFVQSNVTPILRLFRLEIDHAHRSQFALSFVSLPWQICLIFAIEPCEVGAVFTPGQARVSVQAWLRGTTSAGDPCDDTMGSWAAAYVFAA
jgi:hypothetical protein